MITAFEIVFLDGNRDARKRFTVHRAEKVHLRPVPVLSLDDTASFLDDISLSPVVTVSSLRRNAYTCNADMYNARVLSHSISDTVIFPLCFLLYPLVSELYLHRA